MADQFQYDLTLKSAEAQSLNGKEGRKEDRKDKRQDRQNTHTSKIAEQKANNGASLNFEKESDPIPGRIGT